MENVLEYVFKYLKRYILANIIIGLLFPIVAICRSTWREEAIIYVGFVLHSFKCYLYENLDLRVRLITKSDQNGTKSDQPMYQIGIKLDIHIIQTGKSFRNLFFLIVDCDTAVSWFIPFFLFMFFTPWWKIKCSSIYLVRYFL